MSFFSNTLKNFKEEACGVFTPAGFFLNVAFSFTTHLIKKRVKNYRDNLVISGI